MRKDYCEVCGSTHLVEEHHIVFRGQAPALIKCKLNHKYLCYEHHRGTYGAHGSKGHNLDKELKKTFQGRLQMIFGKGINYSIDEISQKLNIDLKATERLVKTLLPIESKYKGEDIIRACLGGKSIV